MRGLRDDPAAGVERSPARRGLILPLVAVAALVGIVAMFVTTRTEASFEVTTTTSTTTTTAPPRESPQLAWFASPDVEVGSTFDLGRDRTVVRADFPDRGGGVSRTYDEVAGPLTAILDVLPTGRPATVWLGVMGAGREPVSEVEQVVAPGDWARVELRVDVPPGAVLVQLSVLLDGPGTVLVDQGGN